MDRLSQETSARRVAEGLRRAHEQLLFDAAAVQAACESFKDAPWDPDRLRRFSRQISEFRHDLLTHFALEEAGGFLDLILLRAPESRPDVEALTVEHGALIAEITSLHRKAIAAAIDQNADLASLRARLLGFLRSLHGHEAREDQLIQRVFYDPRGEIPKSMEPPAQNPAP